MDLDKIKERIQLALENINKERPTTIPTGVAIEAYHFSNLLDKAKLHLVKALDELNTYEITVTTNQDKGIKLGAKVVK